MASVATTSRSRPSADPALEELLTPILEAFETLRPGEDDTAIVEAARAAELAHRGQVRRSGEDYVTHPVAVALTVAELGLDAATVTAALLHDAVEDTGMSLANVRAQFGEVVARVVDGVTKLDRLEFDSKEAQQAATIRKMFVAMATDWRVLLIKLADRLHNMRTIAVMPEVNQRATAQETLDVYAPLAHRLGVQQVKWQLEDLSFATLQPKRYAEIDQMVASRTPEREQYVDEVCSLLRGKLEEEGIAAELSGRPKHLWSIYEKMVVNGKEFDEIFDLVGLRAITGNEHDCWATLGTLHALWHPVQGRFKDYVNQPKFNLYQSLHTTVIGPHGKPIEVQIRTEEMHRRAEYGIAAHWGYKEHATPSEMAWMRRLTDTEQESTDAIDFLEALKLDLEQDEVYVFTPKGRVIALVANSTPVDFAYAVHTEVGHHCVGAKVNGRLVPLDTRLSSADVVEILTSKAQTAGPSRDWTGFVQSTRARSKIRQWFSRERREDSIEYGRDELVRALRRAGLPIQTSMSSSALMVVAAQMNLVDLEALLAAIGESQISAQTIVQRLQRELRGGEEESLPTTVARSPRVGAGPRRSAGVYVEGLDDVMVHLAKCCSPVPGDQIMGFVTQGRGISVHRTDCSNASALTMASQHRLVEVEWDASSSNSFRVTLDVQAFDRARLLADVSSAMTECHLNIVAAHTSTSADRVVKMSFEVELADPSHLAAVLTQLKHVDGVFDAYRQLPGPRQVSEEDGRDASEEAPRSPRGTHDVLPPDSERWERLLATYATLAERHGFGLCHTPTFEDARVFRRGIGEASEVVGKEMYEFEDRSGRHLALRPEGTAPIVRAFVQHRPPVPWRVWYATPAFRYEQPQAGRYRQHHQLGAEVLGTEDPDVDVEVIALAHDLYTTVGLSSFRLRLSSLGDQTCRPGYLELLRAYLATVEHELCDEHRAAWARNPLRVLDCKRPECLAATADAPTLASHLCEPCEEHLGRVRRGLDAAGIRFERDDLLVRGLDYYTRTTFEFTGTSLESASDAIGGGGRYDLLAEALGGPPTPGIGFGIGIERLLLECDAAGVFPVVAQRAEVFVVDVTGGEAARDLVLALRRLGVRAERAYDGRSMKAQLKVADRAGAPLALILGEAELAAGTVVVRDLAAGTQSTEPLDALLERAVTGTLRGRTT